MAIPDAPVADGGLIEIELAGGQRMRISGSYDPEALARLISEQALEQVGLKGYGKRAAHALSGGQRPAVRIQANPQALASNGLGMEGLRSAIVAANVKKAKGNFDGPTRAYSIDANDQLRSPEEYRDIVVAWRAGAPIYLADVAQVTACPGFTEARSQVRQAPPDLLVTNLRLEEYNGLHLVMLVVESGAATRCR